MRLLFKGTSSASQLILKMAHAKYEPAPAEPPPSYETAAQPTPPPKAPLLRTPLPLDLPLINSLRDKRVILASASPRRKQLLFQVLEPPSPKPPSLFGRFHTRLLPGHHHHHPLTAQKKIGFPNIEVIPSTLRENLPKSLSPFEYVLQTASRKAVSVYTSALDSPTRGDPALVIAADTVVVSHAGQVLEKPRSEADHIAMLKMLRNSAFHKVYTGVVAMAPLASARDPGYALENAVEETTVKFGADVSDEMILAYVRTREGADKAGGYGIQGIGAILVERIEGSFDNVVGLPLRATLGLVEKVLESAEEEEMGDEFGDGEEER